MEPGVVLNIALCVTVLAQTCLGSARPSRQHASDTSVLSGECVLPPQPEFSKYTSPLCSVDNTNLWCRNIPDSAVPPNWVLIFTCNKGYKFDTGESKVFAFCVNGSWAPSIPACKKLCRPLMPSDMDVQCQYEGGNIDCSKPAPVATEATTLCRQGYQSIDKARIVCREDGEWSDDLGKCVPDCGRESYGSSVSKSVFPWFVGIYRRREDNQLEHICGGTLISPHIVLTAGHCVYMERQKRVIPTHDIQVAVGKYFRDWNVQEARALKAEVREIAVPPLYMGHSTRYAHDLALLDLKTSFPSTLNVMPACVDWTHRTSLIRGQLGKLTGWGVTENGTFRDTLSPVELPYEDTENCIDRTTILFRHYVTVDKFCSIYVTPVNGTVVGVGYAGGGLTFEHNGRQYVQGVLSTKVRTSDGSATFTFTSLTDEQLLHWIQDTKRTFDEAHTEL